MLKCPNPLCGQWIGMHMTVNSVWQIMEPMTPAGVPVTPCPDLEVPATPWPSLDVPTTPLGEPVTPHEIRTDMPRPVPKTPSDMTSKPMAKLSHPSSPPRKRQRVRTVWPGSPPEIDEQTNPAVTPTDAASGHADFTLGGISFGAGGFE